MLPTASSPTFPAGMSNLSRRPSPAGGAPDALGLPSQGYRATPPERDPFHPCGDLLSDQIVGPGTQPN